MSKPEKIAAVPLAAGDDAQQREMACAARVGGTLLAGFYEEACGEGLG